MIVDEVTLRLELVAVAARRTTAAARAFVWRQANDPELATRILARNVELRRMAARERGDR